MFVFLCVRHMISSVLSHVTHFYYIFKLEHLLLNTVCIPETHRSYSVISPAHKLAPNNELHRNAKNNNDALFMVYKLEIKLKPNEKTVLLFFNRDFGRIVFVIYIRSLRYRLKVDESRAELKLTQILPKRTRYILFKKHFV